MQQVLTHDLVTLGLPCCVQDGNARASMLSTCLPHMLQAFVAVAAHASSGALLVSLTQCGCIALLQRANAQRVLHPASSGRQVTCLHHCGSVWHCTTAGQAGPQYLCAKIASLAGLFSHGAGLTCVTDQPWRLTASSQPPRFHPTTRMLQWCC